MKREHLEHIIRASAVVTGQYDFMILGSQAILGADPNPPEVFTVSMEADIYPIDAPHLADQIEGSIGEFSDFHNTNGYAGYCLDGLDLFLAKAAAGREKDREFCTALIQHGYVTVEAALTKIPLMPLDQGEGLKLSAKMLNARIRRWAKDVQL